MSSTSNNSLVSNQLPISLDIKPDAKGYQDILNQYIRRISNAVNTKESGLYLIQETANFEQWFQYFVSGMPQQTRTGYRLTLDLFALNGGNIPTGTTTLTLTISTQPPAIIGYKYPAHASGGALDTAGISYFPSDPNVTITYTNSTNTITIVNNTGNALTWCVWEMNYLKN